MTKIKIVCVNTLYEKSMEHMRIACNILWNTIGNIFYLVCQWLLSVVVVRISGSYADAGVLTLAISTTNIFATLAAFSVRNYQVSDLSEKYSQSDYIAHRIITCSVAVILCIAFTMISGYRLSAALSIAAYMLMKTVEAFADVFHGILQKRWRLDIVGRSCIYRGVILIVSFTLVYKLLGQLPLALLIMAMLTAAIFFLYDFRVVRKLTDLSCRFNRSNLIALSKDCLPVLGYSLFLNAIVLTTRFFIERYHGEEMLGYYGSVSTIAVIVQTASNLILTPLNGTISWYYAQGKRRDILALSGKVILLLAALTSVSLAGAAMLGEFALTLLFGETIRPYAYLLFPTILASCLTSLMWFLGMLLTIMRQMKALIIGATIGFSVCAVLSVVLIPEGAFDGANIACIIALLAVAIIYILAILRSLQESRSLNKS